MTPQKDCSTTKEAIKSQKNKTKINGENVRASAVPPLKCEICNDVVSNQRQLIVHRNRFHSHTTPLTCDLCNSSFTLQSLYEEHINSKHNTNKVVQQPPDFSCDKCEFSANELAQIKRHKECKHKGTTSPATIKMYKTAKQKGKESSSPPQPEIVHYKYFCDHCDWGGNTLAVFKRHVKNRQGCQLQKINTSIFWPASTYSYFSTSSA